MPIHSLLHTAARLGSVNGALFMSLVPVSIFVIGLVRDHRPPPAEWLGAALVLTSLLVNNLLPHRPALGQRENVFQENNHATT